LLVNFAAAILLLVVVVLQQQASKNSWGFILLAVHGWAAHNEEA
jgi:hypothetical protein